MDGVTIHPAVLAAAVTVGLFMLGWLVRLERRAYHQELDSERIARVLADIDRKMDEDRDEAGRHRLSMHKQLAAINLRTTLIEQRSRRPQS